LAAELSVNTEEATDIDLASALQQYMQTVPDDDKQSSQSELAKFARWVGGDRAISSLAPPEIGEYSDFVSAGGTAPAATERLGIVKLFLAYLKKKGMVETGLAQHLRLRKGRSIAGHARSSRESSVVRLTREGHSDLMKRLSALREERRGLAGEIQRAAEDKDVRENAPLEAAREAQGLVLSRIAELETTLRSAVVIQDEAERAQTRVRLGSTITLKDTSNSKTMTCQIVGPNEASPLSGKISSASPVGSAVLGRAPGDSVRVQTPLGEQVYSIIKTS
jgi:transcription elongation factor GreA